MIRFGFLQEIDMKKVMLIAIIAIFMGGCTYNQQTTDSFNKMSQDIQAQNQRNYEQQQLWSQQQRQEQERLDQINYQNNLIFEMQKLNRNIDKLNQPVQTPIQAPQVKW